MNYQVVSINDIQFGRILVTVPTIEILSSNRDPCEYTYTIESRKILLSTDNTINNSLCVFGKNLTDITYGFNLCNN